MNLRKWLANRVCTSRNEEQRAKEAEPFDYNPSRLRNRSDIVAELGITPAMFVQGLLEENGGQMRQKEFTEVTNFSPATVCRLLQDLEDEGVIRRMRVGKEKIVTLPERDD